MKNQKFIVRLMTFISMLSGSLWLGAYAIRMIVCYQLFDINMNLMSFTNGQNLEGILITIMPVINSTFVLYIIFILSFSMFLLLSNIKLRENGWLFIIVVIIYFTLPFEAYLMINDYKLIMTLNFSEMIDTNFAITLIRDRFLKLSSFPIIIFLSYCSICYFLIIKPFTLANKDEN